MTELVALLIVVAFASGCRAGPGEACAAVEDCREGLLCHEQACRTKQEVAKIQYDRGEAAWRETRARVTGQVGDLQRRMDDLEKQLSGAKSEAEREQIREELRKLRELRGAETSEPAAPSGAAAP